MDVFVRTAVWFVQIAKNYGQNYEYSAHDKSAFRENKKHIVEHAKDLEDQVNGIFDGFFCDSDAQKELRDTYTERMASMIKNEKLRKGFTPQFSVGCRRVTPGYVVRVILMIMSLIRNAVIRTSKPFKNLMSLFILQECRA